MIKYSNRKSVCGGVSDNLCVEGNLTLVMTLVNKNTQRLLDVYDIKVVEKKTKN